MELLNIARVVKSEKHFRTRTTLSDFSKYKKKKLFLNDRNLLLDI